MADEMTMVLQIRKNITRPLLRKSVILGLALTLAACTSQRFGTSSGRFASNSQSQDSAQPEPVEALPSGPISAEPLAPIGGTAPVDTMGGETNVAALPNVTPATPMTPSTPPAANRFSLVGGWTAKDATGASCRVVLSSTPTLDLYRASTSGCTNKDLAAVTAWDYRNGEIYLYQSGGTMAARLRGETNNVSGALTKSGAPISMSR